MSVHKVTIAREQRDKEFQMFKSIFLVLALFLMSSSAFAQADLEARIAQEKAACMKGVSTVEPTVTRLARDSCLSNVAIAALSGKIAQLTADKQAEKKKLEAERAVERDKVEAITKTLKALESAPKTEPSQPPAKQTQPMAQAVMPQVMMSPPPQVVQPPGLYVVATTPMQGMVSPIQIYNLSRAAAYWIGENQEIRVEFIKNGLSLVPAQPAVFELFYSPNKKGAPIPHRGVDPSQVNSVFTSCQANDDLQVIYYTWDGSYINGTSYPAWKRVAKVQFFNFGPKYNEWKINATSGLKTP